MNAQDLIDLATIRVSGFPAIVRNDALQCRDIVLREWYNHGVAWREIGRVGALCDEGDLYFDGVTFWTVRG